HEMAELRAESLVELPMERDAHEQEGRSDVDGEHRGEDRDVPQREAGPDMAGPQAHGQEVESPIMNPTPRTVWISLGSAVSSTLRRRRAMCTSMTLSRGVARPVSFQTSRASISRESTRPPLRTRYSSSSNTRAVRSALRPSRDT